MRLGALSVLGRLVVAKDAALGGVPLHTCEVHAQATLLDGLDVHPLLHVVGRALLVGTTGAGLVALALDLRAHQAEVAACFQVHAPAAAPAVATVR
ncbi:hypothetical protein D9M70_563430 [compost metagenome]